ncbi:O-antigen ligase family protein [Helcococcus massiliensis]|uniref:O-antigen ligase family protein n=1 Tax=Helcococcus massiliensis TaxID=2040290 RepID=UPI000CDEC364|nr:O-antigen ligase family protein [Helcococcus massiliensis]
MRELHLREETRKFNIIDLVFVLFFANRLVSKLFTLALGGKGQLVALAFYCVLYVGAIAYNIKKKNHGYILFFIFFLLMLTMVNISHILKPELAFWFNDRAFGFFINVFDVRTSISGFLIILLISNKDKILRNLKIVAYINLVYYLIQIFLFIYVGSWINYFIGSIPSEQALVRLYNMDLGFELAFVAVIFFSLFIYEKKKLYLVISTLLMSLTMMMGSRGVIVLFIAYFFIISIFLFNKLERKDYKKLLLTFLISFSLSIGVLFSGIPTYITKISNENYKLEYEKHRNELPEEEKEKDLSEILGEEGSRNKDLIKDGQFLESNGRFTIWQLGLEAFKDSPILGQGIFGDRNYVGKYYEWGYSHNIIIEALASFGLVGFIGFAYLLYLLIKLLIKIELKDSLNLIIFLTMSTKLLISDSFWFLSYFWSLLGLIIIYTFDYKKISKNKIVALILSGFLFVGTSLYYFSTSYKNQDTKTYKLDKATVLIMLNGENEEAKIKAYRYLEEKGIVSNVFVDANKIDNNIYIDNKDIEVNDNPKSSTSYRRTRYEGIVQDINKQDLFREKYSIKNPIPAFIAPFSAYDAHITYSLMEYRKFILEEDGVNFYKSINKQDLYDLKFTKIYDNRELINQEDNELNKEKEIDKNKKSSISKEDLIKINKEVLNNTDELINKSLENKSLILLEFNLDNEDLINRFYKVVNDLEKSNFDFISFKDVDENTKIKSNEEKTLKNYLENSAFINLFRQY